MVLCALDLAGLHALRANVRLAHVALCILDRDTLDVRTEHAIGDTMGVADATTSNRGLTANFAYLGHVNQLHLHLFVPENHPKIICLDKKPEYYTTQVSRHTRTIRVNSTTLCGRWAEAMPRLGYTCGNLRGICER